jgi:hypothetical protein
MRQADVRWLGLDNLPVPGLVTMVAEMLEVDRAAEWWGCCAAPPTPTPPTS